MIRFTDFNFRWKTRNSTAFANFIKRYVRWEAVGHLTSNHPHTDKGLHIIDKGYMHICEGTHFKLMIAICLIGISDGYKTALSKAFHLNHNTQGMIVLFIIHTYPCCTSWVLFSMWVDDEGGDGEQASNQTEEKLRRKHQQQLQENI